MNGRSTVIAAVLVVAIVSVSAGVGYALYQGTTSSGHIDADALMTSSVDIYMSENDRPLSGSISIPAYVPGGSAEISGYYLKLTMPEGTNEGNVRLWCLMGDSASWTFIEDMYVTFDSHDAEGEHFGVSVIDDVRVTGLPTDPVELSASTYGAEHTFVIHIVYSDVDPSYVTNGETYASFIGSKFVFALDGEDPLGHSSS